MGWGGVILWWVIDSLVLFVGRFWRWMFDDCWSWMDVGWRS